MLLFYFLFALLLLISLMIIAIPFLKNKNIKFKNYGLISLIFIIFTLFLYQIIGNSTGLKQWLDHGKAHYILMLEYTELGGLDGMILRVQEKLKQNPNDSEGWFILNKLYLMKGETDNAAEALQKAQALQGK